MVKETSPTGNTRMWMESYGHNGEVVRVHPKAIDGKPVDLPHYPPTYKDIQEGKAIETSNGKGKKYNAKRNDIHKLKSLAGKDRRIYFR